MPGWLLRSRAAIPASLLPVHPATETIDAGHTVGTGDAESSTEGGPSTPPADGAVDQAPSGTDSAPPPVVPACGEPGARLRLSATGQLPGRGLSLAWSPDSKQIVAGGRFLADMPGGSRYDARVFDAATGAFVKSFGCPVYWTSAVAWADVPGLGSLIADGNYGHQVFLWSSAGSGTTRCSSVPHFETAEGAVKGLPEINGAVTWLSFSPDRRFLAAANRDPTLRIWSLEAGVNQYKVVKLWSENASANYTSVDWSPDGRRLAISKRAGNGGDLIVLAFDPSSDLWNQATIDDFATQGYSAQAGWANNHLPETTLQSLWSDTGHAFWTTKFSPDGTKVAAVAADGTLTLYDAANGAQLYRVQAPGNSSLAAMDFAPDGRLIAAGGDGKVVYLFDAVSGAVVDSLSSHTTDPTAIAWSPDACSLATTASGPRICGMECHSCTGAPNQIPTCPEYADLSLRIWTFAAP